MKIQIIDVVLNGPNTTSAAVAYGTFTDPTTAMPDLGMIEEDTGGGAVIETSLIVIAGVFFAILTTVGNLMVLISFKIDRQLQTISNYFLFSLAVADVMIGFISIPLMTYYLSRGKWDIGYIACQFWLCLDYLMSNASVLNLLLISFDRFFSVTRPLSYRPRRTTRKALIMISCTYIISTLLWPPWIVLWPYIEGSFKTEDDKCVVQFLSTNTYVTVGTAIAAFYLPVTIMICLYSRVYYETKKRQREFSRLQANQEGKVSTSTMDERTGLLSRSFRSHKQSTIRRTKKPKKVSNRSVRDNLTSAPSSNSISKQNSSTSRRDRKWSTGGPRNSINRGRRWAWLRMCTTRSMNSSEDSSEAVGGVPGDNVSISSSVARGRGKGVDSRPHSPPQTIEDTISNATDAVDSGNCTMRNGSRRSDRIVLNRTNCVGQNNSVAPAGTNDCYTVVIELNEQGDRPTIRLSEDCNGVNARSRSKSEAIGPPDEIRKLTAVSDAPLETQRMSSFAAGIGGLLRNGRARIMNGGGSGERKSEKERKKNERRQESKAAKTLSAILFAFILTWTPYNVIVCWEAFYPNTIPEYLFNISYCLCYINSTINPLCYALCNARFRHTYKRILRCQFKAERPTMANAYYRRQ
ncbi:gar-3 [Pristionchus pacificus]|uniref:Gar-3 n=1 Tax=Pristionchus pacificus TaxID=54126 RepID=A0A2A6CGR5_PRIPA|nr:gar-3 [Pristionchus pacificus]|eukprot:PDM77278.1 gar-3 [Pristionchus pacificus]